MPCAATNSRTALWVVAVFSDSAGMRWSKTMTILDGSHTRARPISRKLLRTRSAFSWLMARSTRATTIWSGDTRSRPEARARIFSARVMPMVLLRRQVLALQRTILRQADKRGVLLETCDPVRFTRQDAGGGSAQGPEEILQRLVHHHDRGHRNAHARHTYGGQLGDGNQFGLHSGYPVHQVHREQAVDAADGPLD